jgi:hypothetical protein
MNTDHTGVEVMNKPAYLTVTSNCLRQAVENGTAASMAYDINKQTDQLSARVAELEVALNKIARGTEDEVHPFRAMGYLQMMSIAKKALAGTK